MKMPPDTHETLSLSSEVELGSHRTLGQMFAVDFGLVSALPLISGERYHLWAGGLSTAFLAAALFTPRLLRLLNHLWFIIGLLLHKTASPLVMGFIFFGTVLPTGLLMRLFGKRPLTPKFDATA